jgi:serine acetyltransferase
VLTDVPANSIAVGVPARILPRKQKMQNAAVMAEPNGFRAK